MIFDVPVIHRYHHTSKHHISRYFMLILKDRTVLYFMHQWQNDTMKKIGKSYQANFWHLKYTLSGPNYPYLRIFGGDMLGGHDRNLLFLAHRDNVTSRCLASTVTYRPPPVRRGRATRLSRIARSAALIRGGILGGVTVSGASTSFRLDSTKP